MCTPCQCVHVLECNALLPLRLPFPQPFGDASAILPLLSPSLRPHFIHLLASVWLPHTRLSLLYRASRDGATPAAFHAACDARGPTLTLIRTSVGYVVGGYSASSWSSGRQVHFGAPDPSAFLFSADSPLGVCARFGIRPACADMAIVCESAYGPVFGDLAVYTWDHSPQGEFDDESLMCLGGNYDASALFPGTLQFLPVEVEVFAVAPL